MCDSTRSSTWAKEVGDFKSTQGINAVTLDHIMEIYELSEELEYITLQGGEPTIVEEYNDYFDYLTKKGISKNITITVVTNLTNINNRFYKMLDNFKSVKLVTSIDAFGTTNDFIRFPSKFNQIEKNLISLASSKFEVTMCVALQSLSVFGLYDFLNWITKLQKIYKNKNKNLGLQNTIVSDPPALSIYNAPEKLKKHFIEQINNFSPAKKISYGLKFNLELLNLTKNILDYKEDRTKQLITYIEDICKTRKINVTDYIPDFYEALK